MLTTGERRKQRGAERKEAAIRLPLQMIKKVAPRAVNKQIGLRKAGVSTRQGLPEKSARYQRCKGTACACSHLLLPSRERWEQHPPGDIKKDGGLSVHCLSRVSTLGCMTSKAITSSFALPSSLSLDPAQGTSRQLPDEAKLGSVSPGKRGSELLLTNTGIPK